MLLILGKINKTQQFVTTNIYYGQPVWRQYTLESNKTAKKEK